MNRALSIILLCCMLGAGIAQAQQNVSTQLTFNQQGSWVVDNPLDFNSAKLEFPDQPNRTVHVTLKDLDDARRVLQFTKPRILPIPFIAR